ncbi:UNVERIFIED_CONTAM: hypothetical protein Slati_2606700 [Sesamum latifolium]|uniref:DUF7910 domain-containing protein n=1 Tax=Sesamum latifolium TaxID=2727402 RepID=A0AAW2VSV8_9LAMI
MFCQLLSFSNGRPVPNNVGASAPEQVKAVNLGGWLVTEGWIKPSLFDGIINKDLLDGTGVQFQSVKVGKYLSAEGGGGTITVVQLLLAGKHSGYVIHSVFSVITLQENRVSVTDFSKPKIPSLQKSET